MLDNEEQLQEQFDSLPFLCRFHYESLSKYLCTLADPLIKAFADFGATGIPAANAANVSPPTSSSNPASEAERTRYLAQLIGGTRDVLATQMGLAEHANYHAFCRLLGRLKTNYQLSELVGIPDYGEWIARVADFTVQSLAAWQWAAGSVYYILGLWSRMVSSMPYLRGDKPSQLDIYVPRITKAYITSRLESVQAVVQQKQASNKQGKQTSKHSTRVGRMALACGLLTFVFCGCRWRHRRGHAGQRGAAAGAIRQPAVPV